MQILQGNPASIIFESDTLGFQVLRPPGPQGALGLLTGAEADLIQLRDALGPHALAKLFQIEYDENLYLGCSLYSTAGWTVEYLREERWDGVTPLETVCSGT